MSEKSNTKLDKRLRKRLSKKGKRLRKKNKRLRKEANGGWDKRLRKRTKDSEDGGASKSGKKRGMKTTTKNIEALYERLKIALPHSISIRTLSFTNLHPI